MIPFRLIPFASRAGFDQFDFAGVVFTYGALPWGCIVRTDTPTASRELPTPAFVCAVCFHAREEGLGPLGNRPDPVERPVPDLCRLVPEPFSGEPVRRQDIIHAICVRVPLFSHGNLGLV